MTINTPGAPGTETAPPHETQEPSPGGLGRRSTIGLVVVFVLIALGALSTMVGLPYIVLKPGPVTNTLGALDGKPLISVSGAPTYPTKGALDFTTVRLVGGPGVRVTVWDLLNAGLRSDEEVFPEADYFPQGITGQQVEQQSVAEMADSQQEAIAVALKAIGQKVTEHVVISGVAKDAPSAAVLKPGDEIVTVDGVTVVNADTVRNAISKHKAGEPVVFGLLRDGKPVQVAAQTRSSGGRTTVGVFLGMRFGFPFDVKINAGDVGGPSAGTMFALGVYDTLTPGSLTGGQRIAGTGTIDVNGNVGPIGGIRQKLVGARDGGARWFLAPADDCADVVGHVPDGLRVVRISTFDEARKDVEAIAANRAGSLPTCTK